MKVAHNYKPLASQGGLQGPITRIRVIAVAPAGHTTSSEQSLYRSLVASEVLTGGPDKGWQKGELEVVTGSLKACGLWPIIMRYLQ